MKAVAVLVLALLFACCGWGASTPDAAVRSALNVLTDVVSPASKLARQGCDAKEALAVSRAKAGTITADEAKVQTAETRARCDNIRAAFDLIRKLHDEAAVLVEEGKLAEAQQRIEDAKTQFRGLMNDLEEP